MRTLLISLFLVTLLIFSSCVSDTPAASQAGNTTPPSTAITKQKPTTATTRPTENIKVTQAGKKAPTTASTVQKNETVDINTVRDKNRPTAIQKAKEQAKLKKEKSLKSYNGVELPSACRLIHASFITKVMGGSVQQSDILTKDGSAKSATDARSCFYKWDDGGNPNGGVLIQVQRNPIPDEFPDWASYYVSAKKNQGDQMPDGSGSYRYKDFPGMGLAGAYNYDLSRYVWRSETDHVFMVAFNLASSEAEQLIWAEKIGKEMMKNFNTYLTK